MTASSRSLRFPGHSGAKLAAKLDLPAGEPAAYALLAHCFTCSKDLPAIRRIAAGLARQGIAVLRFDFTGLGASEGDFSATDFSGNVADIGAAADFLRTHHRAPALLVGHSLGGAAMLAAAGSIPEARAVATIGAPADTASVLDNFGTRLATIEREGEAEVMLAGRPFVIRRQFVEDIRAQALATRVAELDKALLIMHSPRDEVVDVQEAAALFGTAKHPRSFVSLDTADHLLSDPADAEYAADVISAWASRYLAPDAG
ncbi:MAG: alpha/beta fold hydrolase [Xanthomonadales bacterium]|nr:alpha/beta fold hydrolase [Xanthomonadales bacterium]